MIQVALRSAKCSLRPLGTYFWRESRTREKCSFLSLEPHEWNARVFILIMLAQALKFLISVKFEGKFLKNFERKKHPARQNQLDKQNIVTGCLGINAARLQGVLLYNVLSLVNNTFNSLPCKEHLLAEKRRKSYLRWSAYGNYFDCIFDLFNHCSVAHTSVCGKINANQALYCLQRMSWPKPTSDQNTHLPNS